VRGRERERERKEGGCIKKWTRKGRREREIKLEPTRDVQCGL